MLYCKTSEDTRVFIGDYDKTVHGCAFCPCCDSAMCAKKGVFKAHHFAHNSRKACEHWTEPMTQWHYNWQLLAPPECREVRLSKAGKLHIADIQLSNGHVIEIQHSPISTAEVLKREQFYDDMSWIVDGLQSTYAVGTYSVNSSTCLIMQGCKGWWLRARKPVIVDTQFGLVRLTYSLHKDYWLADCVLDRNNSYEWLSQVHCLRYPSVDLPIHNLECRFRSLPCHRTWT